MRLVHIVSIVDGNVCSLKTFNESDVEKAEKLFCDLAREEINVNLTDEDLDDHIMDGYIESDSNNLAINITWSSIEESA